MQTAVPEYRGCSQFVLDERGFCRKCGLPASEHSLQALAAQIKREVKRGTRRAG